MARSWRFRAGFWTRVKPSIGRQYEIRSKTRVKLLYWDGSGTWICAKRLAKGCFHWPKTADDPTGALRILTEELTLLLSGLDLAQTCPREWWRRAA
jgi:transposase